MKAKALGTNAFVEFDGEQVAVERRGGGWSRTPARTLYPVTSIRGIQVSPPSRGGGTFLLIVDPLDASLYEPYTIEYPDYRREDFANLITEIEASLARLGQRPYIHAPMTMPPGSYTHIAAPEPGRPEVQRDLPGQIRDLAEQHAAGILNDAEFASAKAILIGRHGEPNDSVGY